MTAALPQTARIKVPSTLADQMLNAAEGLPSYDNRDFYDLSVQANVLERIRESCRDGFDWLVDQINLSLRQRPYCALIEGCHFDEGNRLFVALNRAFGELVARPYEKPRAQLVHYIQPATDRPATDGTQYESEKLHTDTADWDPPVQLISMVCVRPDKAGGGRSRILDVDTLRQELRERLGAETLHLLESEPVPWRLAPYRGGGLAWRHVLSKSSLCWRRYTIDEPNVVLSDEISAALDACEQVINTVPGTLEFSMCEGDMLFMDNHRTIHARTPIADGTASDRLMIRSWIQVARGD